MFVALLVASGFGLLALPALARPLGRRLAPREWARLCAVAIVGGVITVEVAALLLAAPTVLRAGGVPALADVCDRMLRPLAPGGAAVGWAAAAVAVSIPALAGRGLIRARRIRRATRVEPWLGQHTRFDNVDLVVLPTPDLLAMAVPGDGPQIVISSGLVEALAPAQLDSVLRHELAHLNHRHHRYLALAVTVEHGFAPYPLARHSAATLRLALERWADEEAAGGQPEARATLREALHSVVHAMVVSPAVAAFAGPDTIVERLDALAEPAPRPRLAGHTLLYAPGTVLGGSALVALSTWAAAARDLVAMAGRCPL